MSCAPAWASWCGMARRLPPLFNHGVISWHRNRQRPVGSNTLQSRSAAGLRLKALHPAQPQSSNAARGSQSLRSLLLAVLAICLPVRPLQGTPRYLFISGLYAARAGTTRHHLADKRQAAVGFPKERLIRANSKTAKKSASGQKYTVE